MPARPDNSTHDPAPATGLQLSTHTQPRAFSPVSGTFGALGLADNERESLALKRLRFVLIVSLALGFVGFCLQAFAQPNVGIRAGTSRPALAIPIWFALAALSLFVVTRENLSSRLRIDTGLAFLFVTVGVAGFYRHWLPYADSDVVRGWSAITTVLIVFAVLVPVRPGRMAVATVFCVLTDPLTLWITTLRGNPMPPWNLWLWLCLPSIIGGAFAVVTSRVLFDVQQRVAAARELGSYKLVRQLGAGGMGEVWLAEHKALTRPVAIKLVKAQSLGQESAQTLQRFEREAQATAGLTSVHTIEVYDFGIANDGTFFYAMEYLEGFDLDVLLQQGEPLPVSRVLHLLLQACDSLADAHAHKVVHRDVKPANLFVCRRGAQFDFVKVLDFGIVKHETTGEQDDSLTQEGAILGSPGYIAPEVLGAKPATTAVDVYAVGCVAFELLTGQPVFERDSAIAIMMAHASQPPPRCSDVSEQDIPDVLDQLIADCLAKTPDARPTVADIIGILEPLRQQHPWSEAQAEEAWVSSGITGTCPEDLDRFDTTLDPMDLGPTLTMDARATAETEDGSG